jgi:hypothetical protein
MIQPSLPHYLWWNKEFSCPLLSVGGLQRLSGGKEYSVLVGGNRRLICRAILLPKDKKEEPIERWCDTVTGAVYPENNGRFAGLPTPTGRAVPTNTARLKEAKGRATVPTVVTGVTEFD